MPLFKKGQLRFVNARRWKPIGAIMVKQRRYGPRKVKVKYAKYIKIDDQPYGSYATNWVPYARWLWEKENGPIPKGMIIVHLDENTMDDDLDNLACMTRGDYLRYRDARFPKKLEQRKKRQAVAARKRVRVREPIKKYRFFECNQCGYEADASFEQCPKCASYSVERQMKEAV